MEWLAKLPVSLWALVKGTGNQRVSEKEHLILPKIKLNRKLRENAILISIVASFGSLSTIQKQLCLKGSCNYTQNLMFTEE